jgi:UDP-N-acetylmuramoyl-tripeptide--D-alanyl-D-alanine ligase
LEGFGSEEGVRKGKGELYDFLRHYNGGAFVMWDYGYLQEMCKGIQTIYKYGTYDSDMIGTVWKNTTFLEVNFTKGLTGTIKTNLVGSYNLPNVLAAAAVGKFFNIDDHKIKSALENYSPSNSRSQLIKKGTNEIILDAYNANPSSMKFAIENFSTSEGKNKILVLGAMAELGKDSVEEHRIILNLIEKYEWKNVLLVGGDFAKLTHSFIQFASAKEAGEWLKQKDIQNSFLLIKGSRSTQMEKVLDYLVE